MTWMEDDITFCNGIIKAKLNDEITHEIECPLRESCHRFIHVPKSNYISIFTEAPWDNFKEECFSYWKIDREKKKAKK